MPSRTGQVSSSQFVRCPFGNHAAIPLRWQWGLQARWNGQGDQTLSRGTAYLRQSLGAPEKPAPPSALVRPVKNSKLPSPYGPAFPHRAAAVGWSQRALPMHDEDDPEIEYSPLCEEVTRDGQTVRVQIYRLKNGDSGWSLEVIDQEGASTVWDDLFATDHRAFAEFSQTLETEGIQSFLTDRTRLN